jgi:hypothetical protein
MGKKEERIGSIRQQTATRQGEETEQAGQLIIFA